MNIRGVADVPLRGENGGVMSFNDQKAWMNPILAFLNGWEIIAVLAVVILLFGARRLPGLARGLGQGVREFKNASAEEEKLKKDKSKTEFI